MDTLNCKICGQPINADLYITPVKETMETHQMCFYCNFWREKLQEDTQCEPYQVAIIDGVHYFIDDENSNFQFRGFGGAEFQIEFNDGHRVVTTNLWCQGEIPSEWRNKFPDNARFENNLKWTKIGNNYYLV